VIISVCDGLGVKLDADTEEDALGNSFVHQMAALGCLVREKTRGRLHHSVKRAMAIIRSGFKYNMGPIADGFITDLDQTNEENEAVCLDLIEAA
jgi:1,4-alpha-glucan branching enzyme